MEEEREASRAITAEVITGCAKVEQMGHGLVRVWLYGEEAFMEPLKVIRAKLVMPAELAREMAAKITADLDTLSRIDGADRGA